MIASFAVKVMVEMTLCFRALDMWPFSERAMVSQYLLYSESDHEVNMTSCCSSLSHPILSFYVGRAVVLCIRIIKNEKNSIFRSATRRLNTISFVRCTSNACTYFGKKECKYGEINIFSIFNRRF